MYMCVWLNRRAIRVLSHYIIEPRNHRLYYKLLVILNYMCGFLILDIPVLVMILMCWIGTKLHIYNVVLHVNLPHYRVYVLYILTHHLSTYAGHCFSIPFAAGNGENTTSPSEIKNSIAVISWLMVFTPIGRYLRNHSLYPSDINSLHTTKDRKQYAKILSVLLELHNSGLNFCASQLVYTTKKIYLTLLPRASYYIIWLSKEGIGGGIILSESFIMKWNPWT